MPPIYDDYNDESGFGRVSTLSSNDPTILEGVESYYNVDESGFGEVMTLFSDTSTILEEVSIDYDNKVPIYDDYCEDMFASKSSMLEHHEKGAVCAGYIVEFIHDASENYYERGTHALAYLNNINFLLYALLVLKLYLFCLPMLVGSCSHGLLAHKTPKHRKWVRLRCV
jgi:hypothetical protein